MDWSISHLSVLYTISWTSRPNSSLAACLKICSRKPSDPWPSCLVTPESLVSPNLKKQQQNIFGLYTIFFNSYLDYDCFCFNRLNQMWRLMPLFNVANLTYTWSKGAESTSSTVTLLCSIKWRISPKPRQSFKVISKGQRSQKHPPMKPASTQ